MPITKKAVYVVALLASIALLASCAAIQNQNAVDMERLLAASGFKMKFAETPEKLAALEGLPQRKLVPQQHEGKVYFYYADADLCKCLYVGSEKSYQKFQNLAARQKMAQDYRWAAQTNMDARMNFGMWGPWGPWGPWY
ncbi:MAG: hypothetical protein JRD04_07340 [Deltaproteobacteria bacterium]|nr:hypothetical protein [Deltaproteobacteria bacterium]